MAAPIIRRALLYGIHSPQFTTPLSNKNTVPGSSKKMLDKSRGLNVDCIAYDLEDSVTPGKKTEARQNLRHLLEQPRAAGIREQAVRINSVESGLALDDLQEVVYKAPSSSSHNTRIQKINRREAPQLTSAPPRSSNPPTSTLSSSQNATPPPTSTSSPTCSAKPSHHDIPPPTPSA